MLGSLATLPLPERMQGKPVGSGKIDADQLRLFDEFGIEVPFSRIGQPAVRHFRISAQLYNTLADYEKLGDAMQRLSAATDAG